MSEYEEGERVVSVQIGDRRFAIIPGFDDERLYSVLDLNRPRVGHVDVTEARLFCMTCSRSDCIHAQAIELYLSSTGGARATG